MGRADRTSHHSLIRHELRLTTTSIVTCNILSPTSRRVWIPDVTEGFLPGWVKSAENDSQQDATAEVVVAATGEVRKMPLFSLSPMNPPQFDGVDDIADLTHLNEASVINNLRVRYVAGNIYVSLIGKGGQQANAPDILWVSAVTLSRR